MTLKRIFSLILVIFFLIAFPLFLLYTFQYFSKAAPIKANIKINVRKIIGPLPSKWNSLAQGGEEQGVQMLNNVIPQVSALYPRYIRIDHVYDFYNVVRRDNFGKLVFNWNQLDKTVCDIYRTGAKPFFSLGYMPKVMSIDGSLISQPTNWKEWRLLVKKTIERYSGKNTRLCNQITGYWLTDVYYEVWNEPDLETFGKWSLYGGKKSYKLLYFYSSQGAKQAKNVYHFYLGGPATTKIYKNWIQIFSDYVLKNNLRIDFISWHHYSTQTNDYVNDVLNLRQWLSAKKYTRFRFLPTIISEWGYDSDPNPIADTNVGAAHTVAVIRDLIDQQINMAFLFEIKDGPTPRWGILTHDGQKKPRYQALKMINLLDKYRLKTEGEGSFIKAISTWSPKKITTILVNYDKNNKNIEMVPVTFVNLQSNSYSLTTTSLNGKKTTINNLTATNNQLQRNVLMTPNSVIALELEKK